MSELARQRAANQQLTRPGRTQAAEVVADLGAMQAQDYPGALWSLGLRLPGSTQAQVEAALSAGSFVRTWALRGTLHFVAAADFGWLLRLVGPRLIAGNARRYRQLELDAAALERGSEILSASLAGGGRLDRPALLANLEQQGISTQGQRGVYLLQYASLKGLIYQVGERRRYGVFQAAPGLPGEPYDEAQAAARLARRYFTSHGPAALPDFTWWSGLPAALARSGLEGAAQDLTEEQIEGRRYWSGAGATSTIGEDPGRILLLPGFDELLVAYKDRSASIAPQYKAAWSQSGAMFSPTIVQNGRVIGLWKRGLKRASIQIAARPFEPLTAAQKDALQAAAQAYVAFWGSAAGVTVL